MFYVSNVSINPKTGIADEIHYRLSPDNILCKIFMKDDFATIVTENLRPSYPTIRQYTHSTSNVWVATGDIYIRIKYFHLFNEYELCMDADDPLPDLFPTTLLLFRKSIAEYKQRKAAEFDTLCRIGMQLGGHDLATYITEFV
jgi:hypothetical protein